MTERARIQHDFDCTEATFWDLFLDDTYNQALFQGFLKFPRWQVLERVERGNELHRVVEVEPYVGELPGPIKKIVGESFSYREVGYLDRQKQRYYVRIVTSRLSDKFSVECEQYTEPLDGGKRCRRIFLANVGVHIFGVGGLIERRIVTDLSRSYDIGAQFTNDYVKKHGLS
jgi:hypothetical protein